MKNLLIFMGLLVTWCGGAQAKQERVMLEQIVLLKTYGAYLSKSYKIAKDGLSFIGRMKDGELQLHTLFYQGLKLVNPLLRHYSGVEKLLTMGAGISTITTALERGADDDLLYANEKQYILRVVGRVSADTADDLSSLYELLSDAAIEADDAGRLERIDALVQDMEGRYIFIRGFSDEATALFLSRKREHLETLESRKLFNLNDAP
ncbi:hypothetical protein ACLI09_01860 [Flavobacterium sp. RHBU_24]|uniref:hypothetical protein n=1 Tax=Flavobacterium sp. RHBU_24 TaxID=3391185 RepID=UPI003984CF3A